MARPESEPEIVVSRVAAAPYPAGPGRGAALVTLTLAVTLVFVAWVPRAGAVVAAAASRSTPALLRRGRPLDKKAFAPGACEAFAPTKGDRHRTVFLDAGHGGIDPGGIGTTESGATITEADETLPVELDTMALLRAQGFAVVVSRTRQTTVVRLRAADVSGNELSLQGAHDDVVARDQCANLAKADILIGIYFDAGASPQNAGSLTAYDTARPFAAANERLATLVQTDVLDDMNAQGWQIPDAGVLPDTDLGSIVPTDDETGLSAAALSYDHLLLLGPAEAGFFSTPSEMPGTVIEPLFITDPFEGSIAASSLGQHTIAEGLDQAVLAYFAPAKGGAGDQAKSEERARRPST